MTSEKKDFSNCTLEDTAYIILHVDEEGKQIVHLLDKSTHTEEDLFCKHNFPEAYNFLQTKAPGDVQFFKFCKIVELSTEEMNQLILAQAIRDRHEETIQ